MLKQELIYNNLNKISNDEFKDILPHKTPIEKLFNMNLEKNVKEYKNKIDENHFEIKDNKNEDKHVFVKYITLVDFLKYLTGKYKHDNLSILPGCGEDSDENSKYQNYINNKNNYAYVDSFFYYLSGTLKKEQQFLHGIECYDMFICQKKNCKINVSDDIEYLCDSNYFTKNLGKKFQFEDNEANEIFQQNKKEILIIDEGSEVDLKFDTLDCNDMELCDDVSLSISLNSVNELTVDDSEESDKPSLSLKQQLNNNDTINHDEEDSDEEEDEEEEDRDEEDEEDSDEEDEEDSDEEEEEDSDEEDEEDSDEEEEEESDYESEEEKMCLLLNEFPTQVVVIERCENTLDKLLDQGDIKVEELESAIFQIITSLYVYQKKYKFTHNDLHTNNVMYSHTDKEYFIYKIKDKLYKIPTFGKVYKIIDFGRSIYTYNDQLLCSDSFSKNGTAHTQYNFKPYYNEKKPVVEPNESFDLCRLACSIFDFICDDINNINEYRSAAPIYDLIFSWLYDDNGENVLYKSNGDDKYPGFKLYKMISRIVHKHIPEEQYNHKSMKKHIISNMQFELCVEEDKHHYMDIDGIIQP